MKRLKIKVRVLSLLLLISIAACQSNTFNTGTSEKEQTDRISINQMETDPHPYVEGIDPVPNSTISVNQVFEIVFNQPMDQPSVEAAVQFTPRVAGSFEWADEKTMRFIPDQQLIMDQNIRLLIGTIAKSKSGNSLVNPLEFLFNVSPSLRITSHLPAFDETEISPQTSAFYVSFNLPVVDLTLPERDFPTPFRVEPGLSGEGRWISSSTYAFFPEQGLVGGSNYKLVMNRQLKSLYGTILEVDQSMEWAFLTSGPEVLSVFPDNSTQIPLDQEFEIVFNQPMQTESVAVNFSLRDIAGSPLSGRFLWNDEFTEMKFIPENLLDRGRVYLVEILPGSQMKGGGELTESISLSYSTIQTLSILSTNPANGQPIDLITNNNKISVYFSTKIDPDINLEDLIKVYPAVQNLEINRENDGQNLAISANFETGVSYQILISKDIRDRWNGLLGEDYLLNFVVSPTRPEIIIRQLYDGHTLVLRPDEFAVDIEAINLPTVQTKIYQLTFSEYMILIQSPGQEGIGELISNFRQPITTLSNKKVTDTLLLDLNNQGLSTGIYAVELSADQMDPKRFFILVNHDFIISKLSENQLFLWVTEASSVESVSNEPVIIKNNQSEILYEGNTNQLGILIWDSFYVSDQSSSVWIEISDPDEQQYSLMNTAWVDRSLFETYGLNYQQNQEPSKIFWTLDKTVYSVHENLSGYGNVQINEFGELRSPDFQDVLVNLTDFYNQDEVRYSFPVQLSPMGSFIFNEKLPSQLPNGAYYLSLDGYDQDKKYIQIQNNPLSEDFSLNIDVPKEQYFFDSEFSAKIGLDYRYGDFGKNIPFHWKILAKPVEQTEQYDRYTNNNLPTINYAAEYIVIAEGEDVLNDLGNYDLVYHFNEVKINKNTPYQITVEVIVGNVEEIIAFDSKQVVLLPDRTKVTIHAESFYESTNGVDVEFSLVDWQAFPMGAVDFEIKFQKLIINNDDIIQKNEWVNLYQESLRSNGQGLSSVTVFPNGPGIYKILAENDSFSETKIFFVAGQGLTQFPLDAYGLLPLAVNKDQFIPGETIQLFIPNPFPEPSYALVTVEHDSVSFYDLIQVDSGQKVINLTLDLSNENEYYVSVVLISKISRQIVQGYAEINVVENTKDLIISSNIDEEDPDTIKISVNDRQGNPVKSELTIQIIPKDQILSAEDFIDLKNSFRNINKIGVVTAGIIPKDLLSFDFIDTNFVPKDGFPALQKNNTISWQTIITTDANGNYFLNLTDQNIDVVNEKISILGVDGDVRFGYHSFDTPFKKTVETSFSTPQEVFEGDVFEIVVTSNNMMDFPLNIAASVDLFGLTSDSTPVVNLVLPADGARSFFWKVNATTAGIHDLKLKIENPAQEVYEYSFFINVQKTPTTQKMIKTGKLEKRDSLDLQFFLQELNENSDQSMNLGLLPALSGILNPAISSLSLSQAFENEEIALTLLSLAHALELENKYSGFSSVEPVMVTEKIKELTNLVVNNQNIDGGWGLNPEQRSSEMQVTLLTTWALVNIQESGFFIPEASLENASNYILAGLISYDTVTTTHDYDLLAWQYYVLARLQVENIDPLVLLQDIDSFSAAGKALVSLGINEVWPVDQRSRQILDNLENELTEVNDVVLWKNNPSPLRLFAGEIQASSVIVYAIAKQDPANEMLIRVVDSIFVNQQGLWRWHNTHETSLAIMAISAYISGRGVIVSNYSADAELNGTEIVSIQHPYDLFMNSVQANISQYPLLLNMENELTLNRSDGQGDLYYYLDIQTDESGNEYETPVSKILIHRYMIDEKNENECKLANMCSLSEISQYTKNEPINVLLQLTIFKKIDHLIINEQVPNGFKIIDPPFITENQVFKKYDPLISLSESAFNIHSKHETTLSYYAESIPAGTYYLKYTLLPEYTGQYYWPAVDLYSMADHSVSADTPTANILINP